MDRRWKCVPKQSFQNKLEERVLKSIRSARMFSAGDRVGVAVSGGADSVTLFRILLKVRDHLGVKLLVVHMDHSLRGAESEEDMRFVADLAKTHKTEFISDRQNVAAIAAKNKWNLEDAARRVRYAFFEGVIQQGHATRIAVAHTLDDQAETVLAHILRGTGLTGLSGIYPIAGSIVRPLLGAQRSDLRKYLREIGQAWREDLTNVEETRLRARIRHRLIPALERDFTPQAAQHLAALSDLAREDEAFWRVIVEDRFQALVRREEDSLRIRIQELFVPLELHASSRREGEQPFLSLTERMIRRLYEEVRGTRQGLASEHVRQVIHLASESLSGHRVELPGAVVVERVFGDLTFSRAHAGRRAKRGETSAGSVAYHHVVALPEDASITISVPELKRRFCLKKIDWSLAQRDTKREFTALDADRLSAPLVLRNWRPGDAYRARGRQQAQKLKAMFLARRVPVSERPSWPVLESAGKVAWAFGMPPADDFCARSGTRVGLVIEEESI